MPFAVVLDACVLYPLPLRDTLLRVARENLFAVRWSRLILDEVARNLIEDRRATLEQATNLLDAMRRAFPDAEVTQASIAAREPEMTNESSDRHVLAAAVASSDARTIVTFNLRHFPRSACEPFGIEIIHPDALLCELHESEPARVQNALVKQAAALSRPPIAVTGVLDRLERSVPNFAAEVREALRSA